MTPPTATLEPPAPTTPAPGPALELGKGPLTPMPITGAMQDRLAAKFKAAPAAPAPEPPSQAAKPAPTAPDAPKPGAVSPTPPAPPATPPAAAKTEPATPAKESGPKPLREALERAQTREAEAHAKIVELESKYGVSASEKAEAYTQLAAEQSKSTSLQKRIAEEFEPLRKVHEETAKLLQSKEEALMVANYQASDEYHREYVAPIAEADKKVQQFLSDIGFVSINGQDIPANRDHFLAVLSAPNGREAADRAKTIFGPDFSAQAVALRSDLRALEAKRQEGLKNGQLKAKSYFEQQQVQQQGQLERLRAHVAQREAAYMPTVVVGEDPELKAALAEGEQLADTFSNGNPTLTPEGWADVVARTRVAVKRDAVNSKRLARVEAELATAKEQLAAYMRSEPSVEANTSPESRKGVIDPGADMKADVGKRLREFVASQRK